MKKNRTLRVSALLLALTLITTCFVGGTFAKYTSSTTGSDDATVAKWSFHVGSTEFATTDPTTFAFNLFDTIRDTVGDENDVVAGKIAPGTAGQFRMAIRNTSEVNAKYTVALTETNASNVPLQYSVNGTDWKDSIAGLSMDALTDKSLQHGLVDLVTVYWRWVFDENVTGVTAHAGQTDVTDTALGIAAQTDAPTVIITAKLTATQVD